MTDRDTPENIAAPFAYPDLEVQDIVAIERRARELRAQAFAQAFRSLGRWAQRRAAAKPVRNGQPA